MSETEDFRRSLSALRHDIRNPVGHVLGYGEMIEEELEQTGAEDLHALLESVHHAADRMLRLIDEHLGASKESIADVAFESARQALALELEHVGADLDSLRTGLALVDREDLLPDLQRIELAVATLREILATRLTPEHMASPVEAALVEDAGTHPAARDISAIGGSLGQTGSILIVDDDLANRDLLARRLGQQGYETTCVESGEACLDLLEREDHGIDAVLLDLVMPGLDGEETLRRIKADPRSRPLPVIMLSGLDATERIVSCILQGAEDYLFKPFNPVLLKARIAASLEKRRLREAAAPQLKVFVSSPSDVGSERRVVRRVIDRLNVELTGEAILVPVLWEEEPLVASETAQTQIVLPRETDIYVGIFWSRFGTPLPDTVTRDDGSRYQSGSEFEFEDALAGQHEAGRPDMLVYRKTVQPVVPLESREQVLRSLDQHEQLEAFIGKWFTGSDGTIAGVYHAFEEPEQFGELLETHLRKVVRKRLETRD
jgi:DNA-binding response OmpR family regulator